MYAPYRIGLDHQRRAPRATWTSKPFPAVIPTRFIPGWGGQDNFSFGGMALKHSGRKNMGSPPRSEAKNSSLYQTGKTKPGDGTLETFDVGFLPAGGEATKRADLLLSGRGPDSKKNFIPGRERFRSFTPGKASSQRRGGGKELIRRIFGSDGKPLKGTSKIAYLGKLTISKLAGKASSHRASIIWVKHAGALRMEASGNKRHEKPLERCFPSFSVPGRLVGSRVVSRAKTGLGPLGREPPAGHGNRAGQRSQDAAAPFYDKLEKDDSSRCSTISRGSSRDMDDSLYRSEWLRFSTRKDGPAVCPQSLFFLMPSKKSSSLFRRGTLTILCSGGTKRGQSGSDFKIVLGVFRDTHIQDVTKGKSWLMNTLLCWGLVRSSWAFAWCVILACGCSSVQQGKR